MFLLIFEYQLNMKREHLNILIVYKDY